MRGGRKRGRGTTREVSPACDPEAQLIRVVAPYHQAIRPHRGLHGVMGQQHN